MMGGASHSKLENSFISNPELRVLELDQSSSDSQTFNNHDKRTEKLQFHSCN